MMRKIIISLFLSQIILVFIQFTFTLGRATDGDRLFEIENQIALLTRQNSQLSDVIYRQTTINRIENYALVNGYVPLTITRLDPLPMAARLPAP